MQKTGWTIHSFFLVLSGLKKSFTLDVITRGQSTTIFLCIGPYSAWWQTNDQPGDPRASLLLTSVRRQSFATVNYLSRVQHSFRALEVMFHIVCKADQRVGYAMKEQYKREIACLEPFLEAAPQVWTWWQRNTRPVRILQLSSWLINDQSGLSGSQVVKG